MSAINGLEGTGLTAGLPAGKPRDQLGQEDFLRLMIAQFRNQDPFEPMDNGEFLGQLAQFGTVSGIEELKGAFSELGTAIQSEQVLQAANLVGRSVLAAADTGYLAAGGTMAGALDLADGAQNVHVDITDTNGQLVRRIDLGAQPAGLARFEWDGRDAEGVALDAGHYRVSAVAVRGNSAEGVATFVEGDIESVSLGPHGQRMTLNLAGGGVLPVSDVRRIF